MQLARIIRLWGFLPGLGLVGFLLGCSGERTAAPLEPGVGKQIREEMKDERKSAAIAKKGIFQDRKRGSGRGE